MRFVLLVSLLACAEPQPPSQAQAPERLVSVAIPEPPLAQLDEGRQLYMQHCASCHGETGLGTIDGPAMYGAGALALEPPFGSKRDLPFRTAADVLAWSMRTMPIDNPAALPAEQYVAITAYVINEHGVALERPLDAANAHYVAVQP